MAATEQLLNFTRIGLTQFLGAAISFLPLPLLQLIVEYGISLECYVLQCCRCFKKREKCLWFDLKTFSVFPDTLATFSVIYEQWQQCIFDDEVLDVLFCESPSETVRKSYQGFYKALEVYYLPPKVGEEPSLYDWISPEEIAWLYPNSKSLIHRLNSGKKTSDYVHFRFSVHPLCLPDGEGARPFIE